MNLPTISKSIFNPTNPKQIQMAVDDMQIDVLQQKGKGKAVDTPMEKSKDSLMFIEKYGIIH